MNNFKESFARFKYNTSRHMANFMNGRYGMDNLYRFIVFVAIILAVVNLFIGNMYLSIISYLLIIIALWRCLSRNKLKRYKENQIYMGLKAKPAAWFKMTGRRIADFKTHRYRKCPHCHSMLRLPATRGKHNVNCPRCHQDFTTHIL